MTQTKPPNHLPPVPAGLPRHTTWFLAAFYMIAVAVGVHSIRPGEPLPPRSKTAAGKMMSKGVPPAPRATAPVGTKRKPKA